MSRSLSFNSFSLFLFFSRFLIFNFILVPLTRPLPGETKSETWAIAKLIILVGSLSAVVLDTPLIAVFIPVTGKILHIIFLSVVVHVSFLVSLFPIS